MTVNVTVVSPTGGTAGSVFGASTVQPVGTLRATVVRGSARRAGRRCIVASNAVPGTL